MRPFGKSCAVGLLSIFVAASAGAGSGPFGALPTPSDRIVGLWATEATVGPCNASPVTPIRNTLLFQAGGTVIENPRIGPGGAPNVAGVPGVYQRSQGLGTWSYDPFRRKYFVHLQFDNYVDNAYHGYSTVDREIALSKEGLLASGPIRSARFTADGTLMSEVCGEAVSSRL